MNLRPIPEGPKGARRRVCTPGGAEYASRTTAAANGRPVHRCALWFCRVAVAAVMSAALGGAASGQTNARLSSWTGQLEVTVLRCGEKCGHYTLDDTGVADHDPKDLVSYYTYNVYQNDKGVVRHELISANTGGVNEQGRGAEIFDYAEGFVLAYDPGAPRALRVPLVFPNTTSSALESRKILGFKCNGVRRTWVQQRNQFRTVRDIWTATEIDFRDPLLDVSYGYDASGRLGLVEVRAIRSVKASPRLVRSLFELPPGMGVYSPGNP